jgi:hypothetical protein
MRVIDTVTVAKIGNGDYTIPEEQWTRETGSFRPDTSEKWWQKVSETETTFTIEILGE